MTQTYQVLRKRRATYSIFSRFSRLLSQHPLISFHAADERPNFEASTGLGGRLPFVSARYTFDPYDRHAIGPGILVEVLQEVSLRHPRRRHTQLADVWSCAKSRDHVGMDQPLPDGEFLVVPLEQK